jgi:hypothetical protein
MALAYPDLDPPAGWALTPVGVQLRLTPPGTSLDSAGAAIIVPPLVGVTANLPPTDRLLEYTLEAEAKERLEVAERSGPTPFVATSGLHGSILFVTGYARPAGPMERRIYVAYRDERALYSVNYLASQDAYGQYEPTFLSVARSVRPLRAAGSPAPTVGGG